MRPNRPNRKELEQLIRSVKADFGLPENLTERVKAAMDAAPLADNARKRGLADAGRLVFASAVAVALVVVTIGIVRWHEGKRVAPSRIAQGIVRHRAPSLPSAVAHEAASEPTAERKAIERTPTPRTVATRGAPAPSHESASPSVAPGKPTVLPLAVIAARQPATDTSGRCLDVGDRVAAGSTVRTGAGGRLTLITKRGSEFTLDANSELTWAASGRSADLRRGRLYCRNRMREFAGIATAAGSIELLGTTLDAAMRSKDVVAVTVIEGKVRLANAHGQAVVRAGKKAMLVAQLPPDDGTATNVTTETAWYDGRGTIISDFGEIAYSIRRRDQFVSEVWAMNADGSGKRRVRSYVGSNWSPGPWLPGEERLMVGVHSPVWTFPDFRTRNAIASRGSAFRPFQETWLLDVATGQDMPFKFPTDTQPWTFALSPEGTEIAFSGARLIGPDQLKDYESGMWVYDLQTGQTTKVLDGGWDDAAWSPDSSTLAASQRHSSNADYSLVLVNVNSQQVTDLGVRGVCAAFAPDGTRIAYVNDTQTDYNDGTWVSNVGRIYVRDLTAGAMAQLISPADERSRSPRWSPDGRHILFTVLHLGEGDPPRFWWSLFVAAADGSETKEVYAPTEGHWRDASWARSGDAIYVTTEEGVLLVAPDGSGVLGNLGGNTDDSILSAAERQQTDAAMAAIREAVFQYAVGKLREFEGRPDQAKQAYRAAADLFAALPWECPLVGLSTSNVLSYADNLASLANRSAGAIQEATCKTHLNDLSLLLPWYANEHNGVFPRDFSALGEWMATKNEPGNETILNDWMICCPEVAAAVAKCPMGDAYSYTPPATGTLPNIGDTLLTCPNHPWFQIVWEKNSDGALEPRHLEGFSIGPCGALALQPRPTK